MKYHRTTLLAGIAALALVAGTGFSSAQENTKGEAPQVTAPHSTQSPELKKAPEINKAPGGKMSQGMSQGAQELKRGSMPKHPSQRADEGNRANKNGSMNHSNTAQDRDQMGGKNAAERERRSKAAIEQPNRTGRKNNSTAQRGRNGMEGLQGNASGMNVQLNEQQRSEIRSTVINAHGAPRVSHVDFDVTVGTVVPRSGIRKVPVPETLVRIEPEWRGFLYFVYEDEVVIVNPNDMRIVAVVPA